MNKDTKTLYLAFVIVGWSFTLVIKSLLTRFGRRFKSNDV